MLGNVAGPIAIRAGPVVDDRLCGAPRFELQLADMFVHEDEGLFGQQEPQRQPQIGDVAFS